MSRSAAIAHKWMKLGMLICSNHDIMRKMYQGKQAGGFCLTICLNLAHVKKTDISIFFFKLKEKKLIKIFF